MRPIPPQMLSHTVTLTVPTAVNVQQAVSASVTHIVRRVCLQQTSSTQLMKDTAAEASTATLFVDARLSQPRLDWLALKHQAEAAGGELTVNRAGTTYLVTAVREVLDNHAKLHHYEVNLV